ncbi:hypothetical protein ACOMHN_036370 [Nucella lapillus]
MEARQGNNGLLLHGVTECRWRQGRGTTVFCCTASPSADGGKAGEQRSSAARRHRVQMEARQGNNGLLLHGVTECKWRQGRGTTVFCRLSCGFSHRLN